MSGPRGAQASSADEEAWTGLVRVHRETTRRIDAGLVVATGIGLNEYRILDTLERAEGELRLGAVAERLALSKSGLTRLVDELERSGYARRAVDPDDGRGYALLLTRAGQAKLRAARKVYAELVNALFLAPLSAAQLAVLERAWQAVAAAEPAERRARRRR